MNFVSKIKENPLLIFQVILIVLLIVLAIVFVVVMVSDNPSWSFKLFGIAENGESKYKALKFLGIGMGGILIALQALMSYKRAMAMEDTAKAQADAANAQAKATEEQAKANLHTEKGLRQERLKNAIEHLGDERDSVRLGGAYELFHLAEDTKELRQTVLDILCAHIRHTTGEKEYQKEHEFKPSEEIQSLLLLLFVQEHEVFKGLRIDLTSSYLNGSALFRARLENAVLVEAHLRGAMLFQAQLQGAFLVGSQLQRASLLSAQLQGAILSKAQLQGADLNGTYLQGANLNKAYLQGAMLSQAQLQEAILYEAQLQGAGSVNWSPFSFFADRILTQIGEEADLSEVVFEGGLSQQTVDFLVKGLSDRKAKRLREKLEPHIGQQESNELPEDSEAITGTYTEEEAEQWIAEYEEAMS